MSWVAFVPLLLGGVDAGTPPSPPATGSIAGKVQAASKLSSPTIVYLEPVGAAPARALPPPSSSQRQKVTQKDLRFEPGALVVHVGDTVDFPNEDRVFHNVFSVSSGNEFDLGIYREGMTKSVQMKKAGEVDILCNLHPEMEAKMLVLANELFAPVGEDGSYRIASIPAGSYSLRVWSATHETAQRTVEVSAGQERRADFQLEPRKRRKMLPQHAIDEASSPPSPKRKR
ncbi:MAG: carboxypeptidase regulatory-like domain-containing protein [Myxococcota bacterium]